MTGAVEAWDEEIARRLAEIREGTATGRPMDEVLEELRKSYPSDLEADDR
ncbi:MAG: addiction module protein [Gemmataceae bacterium]|nr:addiction module protein [Gemmataceae bacterium]